MKYKDYRKKQISDFTRRHFDQRLMHFDVKEAIKNATIKIKQDRERQMREISEAFDKAKQKMNAPIYYNGGNKSLFWWKNKLKYKIEVIKEIFYFEKDDLLKTPKIFDTILSKLSTCIGLWKICLKRKNEDIFVTSDYSVHITFSNPKDATYFKLLWG